SLSVNVLVIGQQDRLVHHKGGVDAGGKTIRGSPFGADDDRTVIGPATVKCCCVRPFQHVDAGDIVGIDVGYARSRHTIDNVERLTVAVDRAVPSHHYPALTTHTRAGAGDGQAGYFT